MNNKIEYILCAAIKRETSHDLNVYHNNDITSIEIGFRHHDILARFQGQVSKKLDDQGFYTSRGRFVDRIEAMQIAYSAGQVDKETALKPNKEWNQLYSEDLY